MLLYSREKLEVDNANVGIESFNQRLVAGRQREAEQIDVRAQATGVGAFRDDRNSEFE